MKKHIKENKRCFVKAVILALFCVFSGNAGAATVIIDGSQRRQTIEGMGAAEVQWYPPSSVYPLIFDDLGISALRFQMYPQVEEKNDNADPFGINWNGVNKKAFDAPLDQWGYGGVVPLLRAAQKRGVKIIGSIWSPPVWMKTNGELKKGGKLKTGYEDELVEFILIWVMGLEKYYGIHIDSISIQNEPTKAQTWESCVYTSSELRDMIKKVGARFKAEGLTTGIHAPDAENLDAFVSYTDTICRDSAAKGYISRLATHTYRNQSPGAWQSACSTAEKYGKPLWMTEFWASQPAHIHNALVYGQVSAYFAWELYGVPDPYIEYEKNTGKYIGPNHKYHIIKQYIRYIRPGAIRIETNSDDNDILVSSFLHDEDNNFTIIAVNRKAFSKDIAFNIRNIREIFAFNVVRTSATEETVDLGRVLVTENRFNYILPAGSITTFTGSIRK